MSVSTKPLDGTWELVRAELDGESSPELLALRITLELGDGAYSVCFGSKVSDRGRVELGGTGELRTLTIHGQVGPNAGRTIPCIYQHTGNRLRVCYGLGGETPTEFKTKAGQKRYLATYRRSGKKEEGGRKKEENRFP